MLIKGMTRFLRSVFGLGLVLAAFGARAAAPAAPVTIEPVLPGVWKLHVGTPEEFVPSRFRSAPPQVQAIARLGEAKLPFDLKDVRFSITARGVAVELPMGKEEQVFGLGNNLQVNNRTGLKQRLCPSDLGDSMNDAKGGLDEGKRGHAHAPAPFYVTTRGYGVYVDTARYATFYCGSVERRDGAARFETGTRGAMAQGVTELYAARAINSDTMIIDVPSARGLDLFVFAGPELKQAVQRYNLFCGGGPLPPLWGLGVLYRGLSRITGDEAVKLATSLRDDHIPCDIYGFEPGWQQQSYSSTLSFHKDRWPDPAGSIDSIRKMGFQVNLWEQAFIHPTAPMYKALKPLSGNYLVWNGLVPDFSLPETRKIFAGYHEEQFLSKGVSGFKLDECDHQPISPTPWSFPEASVFPSGMDGEQMHCLFGLLYQQTLAEPFVKKNLRTFGQVRSSWAMATPMPYVVYSDWYEHHDYVRGLSTAGYSGLLWQPEVRDAQSIEELYRRMQTAVLSPQTVINCWYLRMPPWKQINRPKNNAGEIMPETAAATAACRRILELRMMLIPYLYSTYMDYHTKGIPPSRGLTYEFPTDRGTWMVDDQYMLGDALMVAPMFTGEEIRKVYIPAGDWYDFWTNEKFTGPKTIGMMKPLDQIPIFVRGGRLLPLAKPVEHVKDDTCFEVTVRVYGDQPAPIDLYEDDGITLDAAAGAKQNTLSLSWDGTAGQEKRQGTYAGPARYKITGWEVIKPAAK